MWMIWSVHVTADGRRPTAPEDDTPARESPWLSRSTSLAVTQLSSGQLSLPRGKLTRGFELPATALFVVTGYFCLTIFLHNNFDGFFNNLLFVGFWEGEWRRTWRPKRWRSSDRLPALNLSFVRLRWRLLFYCWQCLSGGRGGILNIINLWRL